MTDPPVILNTDAEEIYESSEVDEILDHPSMATYNAEEKTRTGPMVQWLACLIFTAANGVRISVVAVKFHNVYDYTIERHPWQVSENHKPRVHPSHAREIG